MTLDSTRVRTYLKGFEFEKLFVEELGWDRHSSTVTVSVDKQRHELRAIAQKRGVQIFLCLPNGDGCIPDYAARRKIERQVTKVAYEHLLIFVDEPRTTQVWQWVARQPGQPAQYREHPYYPAHQSGDALIQKLAGITIPLDEEEALDLTGTIHKLRDAFDRDRVTKKFYERFKAEHAAFLKFIKGITDQADKEWYASLMLNRLMFIYFIQRKGFLDGNTDYLRNRLRQVQLRRGKGNFLTFYRYFLVALFHEGFAKEPPQRQLNEELASLLGTVPYLNGGLFDVHQLEERNPKLDIPDDAFERLFTFFGEWDWHLDVRPLRNDREINPDVLGYIFEKYINQKQMGAYYTKEDITDYITRNTLVPFLCDAARKKCAVAFEPGSTLWRLLRDDPDRYIYRAVRHGVVELSGDVIPLPPAVAAGVSDVSKRGGWNRPAPDPFGLPTETWREYIARRQRCLALRERLAAGEVHEVNDLVTQNLDIRQFAEDAVVGCEGPELLRGFWHAIRDVTVLDPTCGSGAFLFAALGILEPLYEACLDRMQAFVDDLERSGERHSSKKFEDFRGVLADVERHPNRAYFILKSIVVRNLYGVDLMEEAVEICKLRLFLKLVAQVEQVDQLEPLPDIDFNIRAGNTLVGYTSLDEISASHQARYPGFPLTDVQKLAVQARSFADLYAVFCRRQTNGGTGTTTSADLASAKQVLRDEQSRLSQQLDRYLSGDYGIDADNPKKASAYESWRKSHQPFHWFAEFYGITANGGFDVIIGNPPWKEYSAVKEGYTVRSYASESCGNLHCLCTERSLRLRQSIGRMSFIVQLPLVSSARMAAIREILARSSSALHVIPFDDRPGKLFEGLQNCRSVIFLSQSPERHPNRALFTTRYQRWATEVREHLFAQVEYAHVIAPPLFPGMFPKYANAVQESVFQRAGAKGTERIDGFLASGETQDFVFYQEATRYWVKATYGLPYYAKNGKVSAPAHGRYLFFDSTAAAHAACAVLNSSLFYAFFIAYGDCFHLSDGLASGFPVTKGILADKTLVALNKRLMKDLGGQAVRKSINTKAGDRIAYDEFYVGRSKPIIDEIDAVLAGHYGFTAAELDFVVNYDIKYRMGQDDAEDDQ